MFGQISGFICRKSQESIWLFILEYLDKICVRPFIEKNCRFYYKVIRHKSTKFSFGKMIRLLILFFIPFAKGDRVVQTNSGPVRGISTDSKYVEAFLGIPYAEPPLGSLRFAKPVSKSSWTETYDAKELPPCCVQSMLEIASKFLNQTDKMDEDCLYLNLWVPKTESSLKPIMVFIHGGAYMAGSSNTKVYDGAALSQHGDVIVASINYRVGTLGFYSAFIDEAAGSMGMYDQILAIQWIKDNAKHFGGDPDNIVLFGESAGAFAISLHMVSPLSKNLFKRAILQSGAAVSPMYSDDNMVLRMGSQIISTVTGCAENEEEFKENPKKVVECMRNLPAEKFVEADEILVNKLAFLVPRVGDEFLPINPTDLYRKGEFKDTETLIGVTRDEGSMFTAFQLGREKGDYFGETIDVNAFDEAKAKEMIRPFAQTEQHNKIAENYLKRVKEESRYTYLSAVGDIFGDSLITCSTMFHADFQSLKRNKVYFYVFDYRSPSSRFPEWVGVPHFEEVPYLFGNPLGRMFSENEKELSKDMMDMWVTFAKTGNPSIPGGLKWPRYTHKDPKYVSIGMRDSVGVKPDNFRCEIWRNLYRATIDEEVIDNIKSIIC